MTDADKIRSWLTQGLASSGMSVADLSRLSGVHKSTIFRALKEDYQFVPSSRTLAKLAEALQDVSDLPSRRQDPLRVQPLHIPYELSPIFWLETEEPHQDIAGTSQIAPHPSIALGEQWVGRMRGDSMSPAYQDGDDLHIANFHALKFPPRDGDHVVLRRWREATGGEQWSVRAVRLINPARLELGFLSKDKKWDQRLTVSGLADAADGVTNQIVGLVIGLYRTRKIW